MAATQKIQARQAQIQGMSHNLTMTPQLVQSIKLLQMNAVELMRHVEEEIENNPLLELSDESLRPDRGEGGQIGYPSETDPGAVSLDLDTSQHSLETKLGTSFDNEFDRDRSGGEISTSGQPSRMITGTDFSAAGPDIANIEEYVAERRSLRDHLSEQLMLCRVEKPVYAAAAEIIDQLDEDGFFRQKLHSIAIEKGIEAEVAQIALELVQGFDPAGIAARDLAECLAIQLREKNRYDPAMASLVAHMELLAKRDYDALQDVCKVELDDLLEMIDEIKALEPRPARSFDTATFTPIIPELFVTEKPDGSFSIELNTEALPKVLVNQTYQSVVDASGGRPEEKAFITDCLQNANWLVRSLEQRATTMLKVMTEIVRQQDGFFAFGVSHLRPLSLKQVADAIDMHESTVSRVTSNKYVQTDRGMFELKFFFGASINATGGGISHSARAVQKRIEDLISEEKIDTVLSDDAIVSALKTEGVDIARRTVAKYREAMGIASSVQRRREKKAAAARR